MNKLEVNMLRSFVVQSLQCKEEEAELEDEADLEQYSGVQDVGQFITCVAEFTLFSWQSATGSRQTLIA